MSKKLTISNSRGRHSEEHSRRSYIPFSAEESLTPNNIVIYDCGDDRAHLNSTAEPYIRAYNVKQKRKDRMKNYEKDYVAALESGDACYGKGQHKEIPFHSDVVQIGNRDNLGITDETFDVDYWRRLKRQNRKKEAKKYVQKHLNTNPDVKIAIQILKEVAEEIAAGKYSNILIHGLCIHADEPAGTPHLDFRYSVFIDGEKRGVGWRVSDHKGLEKMGFETDRMTTALQKFREDINSRIEEKMLEHGWVREVKNEHRKHLTTAQYEAQQRIKDAERKAEQIIEDARTKALMMDGSDVDISEMDKVKKFLYSDLGKKTYEMFLKSISENENGTSESKEETMEILEGLLKTKKDSDRKPKKHSGKIQSPHDKNIPSNDCVLNNSDEEFVEGSRQI